MTPRTSAMYALESGCGQQLTETDMNFEKYTIKSQEAIQKSAELAIANHNQAIEPGHLLKAVLETDENVVSYLIKKLNINKSLLDTRLEEILHSYPRVTGQQPYLSGTTNSVLQQAEKELREFKDEYIAVEHLLLAILQTKDKVSSLMKDLGFERSGL
ncbi:MAG TPA: Clp protease N-terminal domain-containing protein, partial [Chryseosolibacter sp.]|nr:Clp protease N-terminal domain-containing protein [Chryseosolibacter sp.]